MKLLVQVLVPTLGRADFTIKIPEEGNEEALARARSDGAQLDETKWLRPLVEALARQTPLPAAGRAQRELMGAIRAGDYTILSAVVSDKS